MSKIALILALFCLSIVEAEESFKSYSSLDGLDEGSQMDILELVDTIIDRGGDPRAMLRRGLEEINGKKSRSKIAPTMTFFKSAASSKPRKGYKYEDADGIFATNSGNSFHESIDKPGYNHMAFDRGQEDNNNNRRAPELANFPQEESDERSYIDNTNPSDPKQVKISKKVIFNTRPDGFDHHHHEQRESTSTGKNPNVYSHSKSSTSFIESNSYGNTGDDQFSSRQSEGDTDGQQNFRDHKHVDVDWMDGGDDKKRGKSLRKSTPLHKLTIPAMPRLPYF